jgi:hypothetical protein
MDFLKKHYEKILLGVMLVGLIGVLVFMLFYIASERAQMEEKSTTFIHPHVKPLTPLDTTIEDSAIARLKAPYSLDFETTNKLFNPMEWQKNADGNLIRKDTKTGVHVVAVTAISPLYLIISLDQVIANKVDNAVEANYVIKVEKQAAADPRKRPPQRHYVSQNDKKPNDTFSLQSIQGAPEDPTALVLKLVDTGEDITISKTNSYRRVDGYAADFRYDLDKKVFRGRRVNDKVSFGGEDYTVVDVNQNDLILMDESNHKKTSLPLIH